MHIFAPQTYNINGPNLLSVEEILLHTFPGRLLFAPIPVICLPPLPRPIRISRPSEVVLVLRLRQPSLLALGFRLLPAFRFRTIALRPAISVIRHVLLAAFQALGCRLGFHRRAHNEPPQPQKKFAEKKKNQLPCNPSNKTKNKKQEEDFCGKLLKKTPPEESGFQTGQFTGFLFRPSD